jgi:hypothetical protein
VTAPADKPGPLFRLTFRPLPDSEFNTIVGLRKLMKRSLRGYGLVCVKVEELTEPTDQAGPEQEQQEGSS